MPGITLADEMLAAMRRGEAVPRRSHETFFEAVASIVFRDCERVWKAETLYVNRGYLRNRIPPHFAGRPVADIDRQEVGSWLASPRPTPVAADRLFLRDGETGARTVRLSPPARKILDEPQRTRPWVLPAPRGEKPRSPAGLDRFRARIRAETDLRDVGLHDLRHTHASSAPRQGETVLAIARLRPREREYTVRDNRVPSLGRVRPSDGKGYPLLEETGGCPSRGACGADRRGSARARRRGDQGHAVSRRREAALHGRAGRRGGLVRPRRQGPARGTDRSPRHGPEARLARAPAHQRAEPLNCSTWSLPPSNR